MGTERDKLDRQIWAFMREAENNRRMPEDVRRMAATWLRSSEKFRREYLRFAALKMYQDYKSLLM